MKIGVISDTHRMLSLAKEAIRQMSPVDLVLHLGDNYTDAIALAKAFPDIKFEYVMGNCDFGYGDNTEKLLNICGKKIFMTHGHRYGVKYGYKELYERAKELNADVALFGHTHCPLMERIGNVHIINPGSVSMPRCGAHKTCAVLFIDEKKIDYGMVVLED
ncbi:metallophosphoesterase [Caldanaerobius polysaccharolyticus]|uniref:metallophosphoesterase n=1 Tax=Caldanaerobius polysaccharolyticus TaxID=44256 RepID=UPI00047A5B24|nr:metallophosphoesterase [Caldanaerobius polysaccharolyticus]